MEQFAVNISGPQYEDGVNNVIQYCSVELPQGTYGAPYAMHGWSPHTIRNSKVIGSYATGNAGGLCWANPSIGFNTGGVNWAFVKDCEIDSNVFTDCGSVAYNDAGSCDGLKITNNTLIRGQLGIGVSNPTMPKQNIEISGNYLLIQNRWPNGASNGIIADYGVTTNITVTNNTIMFDSSGRGNLSFWGILMKQLNNATISNNTIGFADCTVDNSATGTGVILSNNHDPNGNPVPGL